MSSLRAVWVKSAVFEPMGRNVSFKKDSECLVNTDTGAILAPCESNQDSTTITVGTTKTHISQSYDLIKKGLETSGQILLLQFGPTEA